MTTKKLAVRLAAEGGSAVKAELQGIGDVGEKSFERIDARAKAMSRAVTLAFAAAAAAAVAAAAAMVRSGLQVIDAQAKMAASLGTTVESMQVLERAGDLAGVSMGQVEQATIQLTRRLSQAAAGTGPAVAALDRLGLSAQELGAMPLDQRIATIQQSIEDLIPATQRAAVSSQLFGDRAGLVFSRIDTATLRQATKDVHDFGVVVSDQDAAQIERTNDAISRLGLIWRGVANQLAVAVAPTLEAVADAMAAVAARTGPLGRAIGVLFDNIGRLTTYAATFATLMAGRWVVAFAAARLGTMTLTGALTLLRGALIRTGIGALIVGAGELVYWFGRLVQGAGGFGDAIGLLKDVAVEAFDRIKDAFGLIPLAVKAGAASMKAWFLAALEDMLQAFQDLTWSVANGLNDLFGTSLQGARIDAISGMGTGTLSRMVGDAMVQSTRAGRELAAAAAAVSAPLDSWDALVDAITRGAADGESALDDAAGSADRVTEALANAGRAGGSAGQAIAEGAAEAASGWAKVVENLNSYADKAMDFAGGIGDVLSNAFQSAEQALRTFTEGGKFSFKDMIRSMLADLAMLAWRSSILGPIAKALGGALGGGGFSLANIFHSGGMVGAGGPQRMVPALAFAGAPRMHDGGWAGLRPDEVPAILQRGERVLSRREVAQGGGTRADQVNINVNVEGANGDRHVIDLVRQGVQAGLGVYDGQLPSRVRQINANPRGR